LFDPFFNKSRPVTENYLPSLGPLKDQDQVNGRGDMNPSFEQEVFLWLPAKGIARVIP